MNITLSRFFLNLRQQGSIANNSSSENTQTQSNNSNSWGPGPLGGSLVFAGDEDGDEDEELDFDEAADEESGNEGLQHDISEEARDNMQVVNGVTTA